MIHLTTSDDMPLTALPVPFQMPGLQGGNSSPTVLFLDTFTDTNGIDLTSHTSDSGGTWAGNNSLTVLSNHASTTANMNYACTVTDLGQSDVTITCDVT